MGDLRQAYDHLALADQHLAAGDRRIAAWVLRIEEMTARGQDTTSAVRMLRLFQDTLEQWQVDRQAILDAIARRSAR